MQILGFNKTTLIDYPDCLAATVFLGGCNFRCPLCHNGDLVLTPNSITPYDESEVLSYFSKRKGMLEGVCITGGEPTLQPELPDFMRKIKDIGLRVKLDTNGYRPAVIKELHKDGLIDYIAMDIKATKEKYPLVSGVPDLDISIIEESVDYIINNIDNHEFRTTVVKELHTADDIIEITKWLKGCKKYHLQSYRESDGVINPIYSAYNEEEFGKLEALI